MVPGSGHSPRARAALAGRPAGAPGRAARRSPAGRYVAGVLEQAPAGQPALVSSAGPRPLQGHVLCVIYSLQQTRYGFLPCRNVLQVRASQVSMLAQPSCTVGAKVSKRNRESFY